MMVNRLKNALPDWFQRTPAGREAIDQLEGELSTERETHAAAIAEARAYREREQPQLNADVAKAKEEFENAFKAMERAELAYRQAASARARVANGADAVMKRHQQALRETADPTIDAFISKLRVLYYREARLRLTWQHEPTGRFWKFTSTPIVTISNNSAARSERQAAILAAMHEAEELRFSPKTDVSHDLRAIFEDLPSGQELAVVGEGPMPDVPRVADADAHRTNAKFTEWLENGFYSGQST